jgi:O-antigen ligase
MRSTLNQVGAGLAASWRLPLLVLGAGVLLLLPLYLVRGMRLVEMCLAGIIGLLVAAIGFSRPFQTLCVALFLVFSSLAHYLPRGGIVVIGLLLLAAARAVCDLLEGGRAELGTSDFGFAMGVLLAAAATSIVVARNPQHAAAEAVIVAVGLLTYFALSRHADAPNRISAVVVSVSLGLGIATLVAMRSLFTLGGPQILTLSPDARYAGIHGDPNVQAAYANCCVPPLAYALGKARPWARVGLGVLLLLLFVTIIVSQSRAGMLLLALLMAIMLLRERRLRAYAVIGIVILATIALLLPPVYWVRFESIAQLRGIVVDRSLQLRQHALEGGWRLFLDHPWFGVGLGNFRDHTPHFMLGGFMAHNSFLEVAASIGLVGGLAYIAVLGTGWRMTHRAAVLWARTGWKSDPGLAGSIGVAIVVFVLSALTLSFPFYAIVWVLLGLANAARRAAERDAAVRAPA